MFLETSPRKITTWQSEKDLLEAAETNLPNDVCNNNENLKSNRKGLVKWVKTTHVILESKNLKTEF